MENFDGIMVAATNFSKNLDQATMRRFTFKLEFGYLDDAGKKSFFERMFKTTLTDDEFAELKALRNLAPGDFRTVRQEQFYLGDAVTNLDRIVALKEECAVKKDGDHSVTNDTDRDHFMSAEDVRRGGQVLGHRGQGYVTPIILVSPWFVVDAGGA